MVAMRESLGRRSTARPLIVVAAAIACVLAGTGWLWTHYGTTIFFETIRAGFIACFG
jgi:hypothetical protein